MKLILFGITLILTAIFCLLGAMLDGGAFFLFVSIPCVIAGLIFAGAGMFEKKKE